MGARALKGWRHAALGVACALACSGAIAHAVTEIPTDRIIVRLRGGAPVHTKSAADRLEIARRLTERSGELMQPLRVMGDGAQVLRLSRRMSVAEIRARFRVLDDPDVIEIVPDRIFLPTLAPNDALYASQWNLNATEGIKAPAAWDLTTGSSNLVIGIVDTGKLDHAELAGRWVGGYDFVSLAARENDADAGRDADPADPGDWVTFAESTSGPLAGCPQTDSRWHGTLMAGVIGAASNNASGIAGINWSSKLLPVRVVGKCGGYESDIADGMRWAAGIAVSGVPANANIADVLNVSLSASGACSATLQSAINEVVAAGAPIVVAAGNNSVDASGYSPGNCANVITVGAVDRNGGKAGYTNFGAAVTLSAPGGKSQEHFTGGDTQADSWVLTTSDSGTTTPSADITANVFGTSIAAAQVTGVASLVLSVNPFLSAQNVKEILRNRSRPFPTNTTSLGSQADCTTALCGWGIADAAASVLAASQWGNAVSQFAAGQHFAHALHTNGTVYGWGRAASLGTNASSDRTTPILLTALAGIVRLATGPNARHGLVVRADGALWAWGVNDAGQVGDGTTTDRGAPVQVTAIAGALRAARASQNSLALTAAGTVWSWGANGSGQLGDGTTTGPRLAPGTVSGIASVVDVAATDAAGFALKSDGTVWGWGANLATTPGAVPGLSQIDAISGGADHLLALRSDGTVWAWGANASGQLGDGSTNNSYATAVQVPGLTGVTSIAAGAAFSLALKSDGTVWAWGSNEWGQLASDTFLVPSPALVPGFTGVLRIGAGAFSSYAVKPDGSAWAWGRGHFGALGDGSNSGVWFAPFQILGVGGTGFLSLGVADPANFAPQTDVQLSAVRTSNAITVSGIANGASIVIAGGEYSIGCTASFTAAPGTIDNGQVVCVRQTAAASCGQTTTTTLSITGFPSKSFSVTTRLVCNTTPNPFFIRSQGSVALGATTVAGPIGFGGIDAPTSVAVTGGEYSIGCTGTYVSSPGTIAATDEICIRQTAAATHDTLTTATLTVGGVSAAFDVMTIAGPSFAATPMVGAAGDSWVHVLRRDGTLYAMGTTNRLGNCGFSGYQGTLVPITGVSGIVQVPQAPFSNPQHTLVVRSDGTLWGWGFNAYGEVGDGTNDGRCWPARAAITGVTRAARGERHSLALKGDGTVWAWGYNGYGQLGDGGDTSRALPAAVAGLSGIVAVSASSFGSFALGADGVVRGWGSDLANVPAAIPAMSGITAISAGGSHLLALKADGTVWAWGYNGYGQLGDGTIVASYAAAVQVSGLADAVAVAAGLSFSLALKSDGTVWAWGANDSYQLGREVDSVTPVRVLGVSGVLSIAASRGTAYAIKPDGTVWRWGYNAGGATPAPMAGVGGTGLLNLGLADPAGFAPQTDVPFSSTRTSNAITVSGIANGTAIAISGGEYSVGCTAAFTSAAGTINSGDTVCVRQVSSSSCGATTTATLTIAGLPAKGFSVTTLFICDYAPDPIAFVPQGGLTPGATATSNAVTVTGINGSVPVSVSGGEYSVGCTASFTALAATLVGGNTVCVRQVAAPTPDTLTTATLAVGDASAAFDVITAPGPAFAAAPQVVGGSNFAHALDSGGRIFGWGDGAGGTLGDGSASRTSVPVPVTAVSGVVRLAPGSSADHSLALRGDGTLWSWGSNSLGQLGGAAGFSRAFPMRIATIASVARAARGSSHSLALKVDGTVWAWGDNSYGQLGNGSTTPTATPAMVPGLAGVAEIAGSAYASYALKTDGMVWGWGRNLAAAPAAIPGLSQVTAIAAGGGHLLALRGDGTVWAWGDNFAGQLGFGTTTNVYGSAQQVPGLTGIVAVAAGGNFSLALASDGAAWAWGYNVFGNLGDGTTVQRLSPVRVLTPPNGVQRIGAGTDNGYAVKPDGSVWAWGRELLGALGNGSAINQEQPTPVRVVGPGGAGWLNLGVTDPATFAPQTDAAYSSVQTSNAITVTGIANGTAIAVSGGTYSVGCTTTFTSTAATIDSGQTVCVRVNAAATCGTTTVATLTIAGLPAKQFSVTTLACDATPEPFSFRSRGGVAPSTTVTSDIATITGLIGTAPVTISGGEYSIGCTATFTAVAGAISNNETVCVRQVSSSAADALTTATLTIGGVGAAFDVMTAASASFNTTPRIIGGQPFAHALRSDGAVFGWGRADYGQLGIVSSQSQPWPVPITALSGVVRLSAGSGDHTLAVRTDGTLWAWGYNYYGQLGDGTEVTRMTPARIAGLTSVSRVARGMDHSLALKSDGTVWSWGANTWGQLGSGNTGGSRNTPAQVPALTSVTEVAAGDSMSFALKGDGSVWGWGQNLSASPAPIAGLSGITAIAARTGHLLARKGDGTVWAWGSNSSGQLGNGTTTNSFSAAQQVAGLSGIVAVDAGNAHSLALKGDGSAWAWGGNYAGELGDGTTTPRSTPVQVLGLAGASGIAAGGVASYAWKPDGSGWAWGDNWHGALGVAGDDTPLPMRILGPGGEDYLDLGADPANAIPKPFGLLPLFGAPVSTLVESNPITISGLGVGVASPVAVSGGEYSVNGGTFTASSGTVVNGDKVVARALSAAAFSTTVSATLSIGAPRAQSSTLYVRTRTDPSTASVVPRVAIGDSHTYLLAADATVSAAGYNGNGQLGNGTTLGLSTLRPVAGLAGVRAVASGGFHGLALRSDGSVAAWGSNVVGQLGHGSTSNQELYFVNVSGLGGVAGISAGRYHSAAVKVDGTVWAWGLNGEGQVGDGSSIPTRAAPVQVAGLASVIAVAAGGRHTLALLVDGTVRAWGANEAGQLGDGSTTQRNAPAVVSGLADVVAIAAGDAHSLAIKRDGSVVAWGFNAFGQLGVGDTVNRLAPTPVASLGAGVGLIAAGANHSLAVKAGGALYAWGNNSNSQVGNGNNLNQPVPVALAVPVGVVAIAAGARHSAAITRERRLYLWGDNFFGQVGNRSGNYSPHSSSLNVLRGDSVISTGTSGSGGSVGTASNSGSSVLEIDNQQTGYSFGAAAPGAGRSVPGKYKNASATADVTGIGVSVAGTGFSLSGGCPATLVPDQECAFTIGFNPPGASTYYGELVVQSSVVGSPERRALVGVGVAPATAALQLASPGVDFPPQTLYTSSAAAPLTVTNTGSAPLTVSNVASTLADFAAGHDCVSVAPGASCALSITFTPLAANARSALLTITSNASGAPQSVTVSGTGVSTTSPPPVHALTVSRTGTGSGTVASTSPAGAIDCGAMCNANFNAGTVVTLVATAAAGSAFTGWSGACAGSGSCAVTMDAAKSATATFHVANAITSANAASFTVASAGSFTVTAAGNPAPTVSASGLPAWASFVPATRALTGTPPLGSVGAYPIAFTAANGVAPDATQGFTLTVAKASQAIAFGPLVGRTIGDPPFGISATGGGSVNAVAFTSSTPSVCTVSGTTVALVATGACTIAANQAGDANYLAAATVSQTFAVSPPGSYGLTVARSGAGTGTVTSAPAGIDCGSTCAASYVSGTAVTLSQSAASGSVFAGWSGACTGTGSCLVRMDAARTVTATFALQQAALGLSATALDFGGQSMATTSAARAVTVSNTGGGTLTISAVTVSDGQFARSHDCATLPAGASCTVHVVFTPAVAPGVLGSTVAVSGTLTVATVEAGSGAVALAGIGEKSLVTHYYASILRREPDAGGKAFWQNEAARVAALGASVDEVWFAMAQAFYSSAEYAALNRDSTGFVNDLYTTFFNRAPDSGGLGFWVGNVNSGMPREVALAEFMFSPEFRNFAHAIFGSTPARAEVDAVVDFYRGLLSRLPDNGGFAFWRDRFRAAQCQGQAAILAEVEAISSAFALSPEYSARSRSHAQYVGDLYNAFMRRGGDLAGVLFWIDQVASGAQTREQARVQFRNSPEFQARVAAIVAQGCLP